MKIVTDTSSLVSIDEANKLGITSIPIVVLVDGQSYHDYLDINSLEMINRMNEGALTKSSQPTVWEVMKALNSEEETIVLSIGDGLSGTYSTYMGVKNSMEAEDRVCVLDSKTLAGALHYLVMKAVDLKSKNKSMKEIVQELQYSISESYSFVIPFDFEFLKRSGRLTPIAAKLLSATKVVPVLTQSDDKRKIEIFKINRTMKKAIDAVVQKLKSLNINENYVISICHACCHEKVQDVYNTFKKEFKDTVIELFELSPALCCHGGPGSITVQAIRK